MDTMISKLSGMRIPETSRKFLSVWCKLKDVCEEMADALSEYRAETSEEESKQFFQAMEEPLEFIEKKVSETFFLGIEGLVK